MFSGLQSLVKQKKQQTHPTSSTSPSAPTTANDPYAAAQEAVAKRIGSTAAAAAAVAPTPPSSPDAETTMSTPHTASTIASVETAVPSVGMKRARSPEDDAPHCAPAVQAVQPVTEADFEAERENIMTALEGVLVTARQTVGAEMARIKAAPAKTYATSAPQHPAHRLPQQLLDFLEDEYILEKKDAQALPTTMLPDTTEAKLVLSLRQTDLALANTEMAIAPPSSTPTRTVTSESVSAAMSPAAAEVHAVLHVLWYRLLQHWQASILGTLVTNGDAAVVSSATVDDEASRLRGWCYPVYLLSLDALPDELKYTKGHAVARSLATWRNAKLARWHCLRLLAILVADLETLQRGDNDVAGETASAPDKTKPTRERASAPDTVSAATEAQCYLPQSLRHHLYEMLVLHLTRDGDTRQAQQDYAEMAMGNANWKLGLFSAGEVHMRRSMEKVERNRIAHLLNNEPAMQMLRAMKEVVFSSSTATAAVDHKKTY